MSEGQVAPTGRLPARDGNPDGGNTPIVMAFPQTRQTLIRRITSQGSDDDWRQFLNDYWGPICGFASRRAGLSFEDAEDVASKTFEALLTNNLLARWQDQPSAKLRTLLCSVVQNVLSNRARVEIGRKRLLKRHAEQGGTEGTLPVGDAAEVSPEQADIFYVAWVEQLLRETIDTLLGQLHREGKGDYFRVLYGRICEQMTVPQISEALGIKTTSIENYYKAAKKRLADELKDRMRAHVVRYCDDAQVSEEFRLEWEQLAEHLRGHGGFERAIKQCFDESSLRPTRKTRSDSFLKAQRQFRQATQEA